MMTVTEALSLVLGDMQVLQPCDTSLEESLGRILAQDLVAPLDLPPFPNSAMDGFAVRSADVQALKPNCPLRLQLLGETRAGDPPTELPPGAVCLRIMTGAPIPRGADAVVMKEETSEEPGGLIRFSAPVAAGENIRAQGQDIRKGQRAVPTGTLLRPPEVAMAAAFGYSSIQAVRRPRVAVFSTGDEVVPPGSSLQPGQIFNSNQTMISALCSAAGFEVARRSHLSDDLERTLAALQEASRTYDAVICSGGVSVGEHDYVRAAIERLGEIRFWRVSMKPGKPLVYGRIGSCPVFGLPGNPVSSMVSFELFVRPALLKMAGHERTRRPLVRARLLAALAHRPGREEYARVLTTRHGEEFVTTPFGAQGSNLLSSMVGANSLAIIPSEAGSLPAGARVDVLMTGWPEE